MSILQLNSSSPSKNEFPSLPELLLPSSLGERNFSVLGDRRSEILVSFGRFVSSIEGIDFFPLGQY
jgi:hypothetical protein